MRATPQQPPKDVVARYLWSLWRQGRRPDIEAFVRKAGDLPPTQLLAVLRVDQHEQWRAGERPSAEVYLQAFPQLLDCPETFRLIYDEILLRQEQGELIALDEYYRRFPPFAEYLWEQFQQQRPPTSEESLRWLASRNNFESNALPGADLESRPIDQAPLSIPPPTPQSDDVMGHPSTLEAQSKVASAAKQIAGPATWPKIPEYNVLAELGRGGMGVVYKARHRELNRLVALKMIRAGVPIEEAEIGRFRAEGKALGKLQHGNIVQIFEVGEYEGNPYFAVEFIEGGDLAGKLRVQLPQPQRAASIMQMLADAIHYAHQQGIIHRDLKPANVLLAADGTPKIADFGLAKRLDASKRRTASGAIFGTPYYMAPEQAEGLTHEVGPTADIYALGAMLYEMLAGRPPFRAATVLETLELVRLTDPVSPRLLQPGMPRDLETICLKCLEKDPKRRYASGAELAADLGRYLHGEPIHARRASVWELGKRWARRYPRAAATVAATVLVVACAFGVMTSLWLSARHAARQLEENRNELQRRLEDRTSVPPGK
jgi:serine/threonine protein kinase